MPAIDRLRELLAAAHDRPWFDDTGKLGSSKIGSIYDDLTVEHGIGEMDLPEDAELTAAAVNALPALLDMAEAAAEVVERAFDSGTLTPSLRLLSDLRNLSNAIGRLDRTLSAMGVARRAALDKTARP